MPLISKKTAISMGIPKRTLQTIEIPREWGIKKMREWLNKNNYASSYYRRTINFYRFMQTPPIAKATYHSKKLPNDVILVYQEYE